MILGVAEWRGAPYGKAMIGLGNCRLQQDELEKAHSFFQRVYLLFKGYDDGLWAAKGYLAAAQTLETLGREDEARSTLQAMLDDSYTQSHRLASEARERLERL